MWIISEIIRSHVGYLLFCMKRSLMQVRTLVSHLVFYVLGIGGKLCLLWQRSKSATRIALGHHMDDILETLLMNITYQGTFSSMPPRLVMKKFDMTIIRPMCLVHEADLMELAEIRAYRKQVKNCPYESQSSRSAMKRILHQLEEMNPEARYSLWGSMSNVQEELLPRKLK